jgi:hypothetical protein
METLKKIVTSQYFPAAAVLAVVVLFWAAGLMGGLSMLNDNNPPIATLTWMLFVYAAAVLTPLAGLMAAVDLVRRWLRNRNAVQYEPALVEQGQAEPEIDTAQVVPAPDEPVSDASQVDEPQAEPAPVEPARESRPAPVNRPAAARKPATINQPAEGKASRNKAA